ncbi:MAG TPA: DUF3443 family protein, partial [Sphingomicrobium sp.]|nr:DUF3443 family protein [Sphingomicrobium sp.]
TVIFGIGTQPDNALTATNVLPLTNSSSQLGPGVLTVSFDGEQLTESFLDSGSDDYYFVDASLPACTQADYSPFYCPSAPSALSPTLIGTNGATASGAFTLYSPLDVSNNATAAPGLGVNPTLITPPLPFADTFDFGIPFFFGRTVYVAIEGRSAGRMAGPYFAF